MSCIGNGLVSLGLVLLVCGAQGFFLPNVTRLEKLLSKYQRDEPHSRVRRAIPRSDQEEILMLHNKLRGQVYPPASNMEYMVSAGSCTPARGPGLRLLVPSHWVCGRPGVLGSRGSPASVLDAPLKQQDVSSPAEAPRGQPSVASLELSPRPRPVFHPPPWKAEQGGSQGWALVVQTKLCHLLAV